MTENKRFELIPMSNNGDVWYGLFDNLENEYVTDKLWEGSEKVCDKLNELADENGELKKALLFYLDIAISESPSDFQKDLNKECNLLFNCNYEEAKRKYGDFEYKEWWESE